jgi:hypothetical protein
MSMPEYVIGGMDLIFASSSITRPRDGRSRHQMGDLSAFRDDYRQGLAWLQGRCPQLAAGGSVRTGGYGHGRAIDVTSEDDDEVESVWKWIDAYGAKFGLHRPMPIRRMCNREGSGANL